MEMNKEGIQNQREFELASALLGLLQSTAIKVTEEGELERIERMVITHAWAVLEKYDLVKGE